MPPARLSFSIGPVQDFIAAARTMRDLWTGSYLLSWLTAHAIVAFENEIQRMSSHSGSAGQLIFPDVAKNPLVETVRTGTKLDGDGLLPCLPNRFLASLTGVTDSTVNDIKKSCEQAVTEEWRRISDAVREALKDRSPWREATNALWRWTEQCGDYWDVRVTVVTGGEPDIKTMQRLLSWPEQSEEFVLRKELLGRLAAAEKSVRRYSAHEPDANGTRETRPKCSLLGSFAQMGPVASPGGGQASDSQMRASRMFWDEAAKQTNLHGTRIGNRDRMCAIALVKRFAWAAYFRDRAVATTDRDADFEIGRRYPDIDTICAAEWVNRAELDRATTHAEGEPYRPY